MIRHRRARPRRTLRRPLSAAFVAVVAAASISTGGPAASAGAGQRPSAKPTASLGGADLTGWRVVVGDGVWSASGERSVSDADVETRHRGTYSELFANVQSRGVMAHNITYLAMPDVDELKMTHRASIDFRLPVEPSTQGSFKAQTLEIGLFVWDGIDTRLDHGLAMQWVLNPWVPEYGALRVWRNTARGPRWERVGFLEPDIAWHTVSIRYRPKSGLVQLRLDQRQVDVSPTLTPKPDSWGSTIGARFQVEAVSLWPGERSSAPVHRAQFRNWSWTVAEWQRPAPVVPR